MNLRKRIEALEHRLLRTSDGELLDLMGPALHDPQARQKLELLCAGYQGRSLLPELWHAIRFDETEKGDVLQ